jgi:3-methylcrotonyl-CoA carboxylase alpha subunit
MTDAVRKAMTDAAIKAAKAVDYVGAGTVEFIVDGSGKLRTDGFWFMEMNTRLQVEHPVTEEITGLDLVEWQIRVARGEALPKQDTITMTGHAIEARIYAEDPANDFLPSVGQIRHIDLTTEIDSDMRSRVDTSVEEGDVVSIFYDPMIAKAIVWSESREYTSGLLQNFISDIEATGVTTNAGFVTRCLNHPAFLSADISTHFIEQYSEALQSPDYLNRDEIYAIAARTLRNKDIADDEPFSDLSGWRLNNTRPMIYRFAGPSGEMVVELNVSTQQDVTAHVNGRFVRLSLDDEVQSHSNEEALSYEYAWSTIVKPEYVSLRRASETIIVPRYIAGGDGVTITSDFLTAPMPGKIIALNCAPGDTVKFGDPLVIMEAMKMEQTLSATRDGIVAEVGAAVGDLVTDGALLVRLVEEET